MKYKNLKFNRLQVNASVFLILLFIRPDSGLGASTLKIEFEFNKIPPRTGVLYFPEDGKLPPSAPLVIDQINKKFTEILSVGTQGSMVVFKNSDSVDHNIYANDLGANVYFDVGLSEPGEDSAIRMDWNTHTVIRIGCKIHPRMKSYIANIPSMHYKIFRFRRDKKRYRAMMKNIPDELSHVKIWLPSYSDVDANISIGETKIIPLFKRKRRFGRARLIRELEKVTPESSSAPHLSEREEPVPLTPTSEILESHKPIPAPGRGSVESNDAPRLSERADGEDDETVPTRSTSEVSESLELIPAPGRGSGESDEVHRSSEILAPRQEKAVSRSGNFVSKSNRPVRKPQQWFSETNDATNISETSVPRREKSIPVEAQPVIPDSKKPLYEWEKWLLKSDESDGRSETLIPRKDVPFSGSENLILKSDNPSRESEKWFPVSGETARKSKQDVKD